VTDIHELALKFVTHTNLAQKRLEDFAAVLGKAEGELMIAGHNALVEDLKTAFSEHLEAQMLHLNTSMEIMKWRAGVNDNDT
jgi:hypothetical protein